MRAILASERRFAGYECKLSCGKKIKAKDIILHQRIPDAPYGSRDWVCHARCMDAVVANAMLLQDKGGQWSGKGPTPSKKRRFDRLKEAMLTEGSAFVDLS